MKKQLVTIPNKILSEVTQKVTSFDNKIKTQVESMRSLLKTQDGAGLAANQIGDNNRVIVVELEDEKIKNSIPFQAFINPEIVECSEDKDDLEEGCLSVPQIELPVERSTKIKIRFQDLEGKKNKLTAKDIFARILQHEIDHLNGIIFTERVKEKFLATNPNLKNIKIAFFGSGNFAATILEGLILLGLKLEIFTESAKPSGRHKETKTTPVAQMAQRFSKKVIEVDNFSNIKSKISDLDLLICTDFGQKIPVDILKLAKITAINVHPSLLPKYRGPTPIQTAILDGAKETGVSIIKMSEKIDEGDILAQIKTDISEDDNSLTLSNMLATLSLKLIFEALPLIVNDQLQKLEQNEKKATLTKKFQKADGEIDWNKQPDQIERQIRAFYPWPGSYTFIGDQRLIIHKAHITDGKLALDIVQAEGKKPTKWSDFLLGFRGETPQWFDKVK
ncbi:MAG: peptide deformylase [Patescibacteria group bacterium]|jgi:methionyl-tRNA formyltransferase